MSEVESRVQPLVNASPDIKSSGQSQECISEQDKGRQALWLVK